MSHAHDNASHGTVKSYMVGFVLSVILTAIPFWMVMGGAFTKQATLIGILAMAVVQIVVQLKYFLHLDFSKEGKLNTFSFLFTGMVIVLLVVLSIWIIYTADALMMR
ncbi:cytochrome o ubiquinol oxidase subunit IV [Chromobacterium violaceum]|uniref:Cytochrome bo(3) ubiquinol oxidase subunit 4 n=2 Tax=Chromobacterium violaceum TaxID=536 RepID=A0A1R0MCP3_CHRVL|nr:cytochrome o ubiquinol oxidase subunit IV [Chromobacterium violaceum]AAQ61655.1 cytochrome o ubiquinol oxidase subunit IV [Chromobacterium violaceum ATCC 12472]KJH65828.1 cytochrome C oxidase [Chromobacterium violaceum]KMN48134.1 cytochrome C oxidase [Chromobacterium violaceum]KMN86526.1 cytochrome C oxidase [Chromobacterium violaceum]KMN90008.1 cytochrome C oxidase [Chromobacterium violaceum]